MSTSFELLLDDTSPVISYFPFAETLSAPDTLAGWNSYYSQSGFADKPGKIGFGDTFHVTGLDGAAFTIQWFGTGITLFGIVSDAAYQVSLDGIPPIVGFPRQDVLVDFQGLETKNHSIALVAHPSSAVSNTSSFVSFDRAVVNVSTPLIGAAISSEIVDVKSPRWSFNGNWTERSPKGLTSVTGEKSMFSKARGNAASITFTGSAVSVIGVRNATCGHYNVTLDGVTTRYDARTEWSEFSTLFLEAGLQESTQHILTVTNDDNATLAITALNVTHVSGGTLPEHEYGHHITSGTIIGVVLASVFGVLTVMTAVACIFFRQRRVRSHKRNISSAAISSASLFRDRHATWSPSSSTRGVRAGVMADPTLQSLYGDASRATAERDVMQNNNEGKDGGEAPVVLFTRTVNGNPNPSSPLPYIRSSKMANSAGLRNSMLERVALERATESPVESVVRDLLPVHVLNQSKNKPSKKPSFATSQPLKLQSHKRDSVRVSSPLSREYDNILPSFIPSGSTTNSPPSRHSSLLLSPVRDNRRATFRSAENFGHDTRFQSPSTFPYATPWDEHRESEETAIGLSISTSPPSSLPNDIPTHLRRPRPQAAGTSTWKPPW